MIHNILSYVTDVAMITFVFFTHKIILAVASVGFLSPSIKEGLIESKEIIGLVVVILTVIKLMLDIKNRKKK